MKIKIYLENYHWPLILDLLKLQNLKYLNCLKNNTETWHLEINRISSASKKTFGINNLTVALCYTYISVKARSACAFYAIALSHTYYYTVCTNQEKILFTHQQVNIASSATSFLSLSKKYEFPITHSKICSSNSTPRQIVFPI